MPNAQIDTSTSKYHQIYSVGSPGYQVQQSCVPTYIQFIFVHFVLFPNVIKTHMFYERFSSGIANRHCLNLFIKNKTLLFSLIICVNIQLKSNMPRYEMSLILKCLNRVIFISKTLKYLLHTYNIAHYMPISSTDNRRAELFA